MKRIWRPKQQNPIDPVPDYSQYQSYQKIINSNKGEIDNELLEEHIEEMMASRFNWEEVIVDFNQLQPGDRIRYTCYTPKGKYKFRTGGWVSAIDPSGKWLAYHSHTHTSWSLQKEDVVRLFVVKGKRKKKIETIIYFNVPGEITEHNSYLKDSEGILIRVGSFRDNWSKERFENSKKFRKAVDGAKWIFKP
jgi:hypothetical protein